MPSIARTESAKRKNKDVTTKPILLFTVALSTSTKAVYRQRGSTVPNGRQAINSSEKPSDLRYYAAPRALPHVH